MAALTLTNLLTEVRAAIKRDTSGISDTRLTYAINWAQRRIAERHTFEEMEAWVRPLLIEDCEDAWTAKTNVTCSVDSDEAQRGDYAAKMAIAAGHTTGLAATEDFSAVDLTDYTHLRCEIMSDVANAANGLQMHLDDTSACASALETLNVGALTADTWSTQTLKLSAPSSDSAIISVGLYVATDVGAQNVYVDDVRAIKATANDVKRYSAPTRCKDILSITLQDGDNSRKLVRVPARYFDLIVPRSRQTTSDIPGYYVDYGDYYELYPIPDDVYGLNIRYSRFPADLSGTNTSDLDNKDHIIIAGAVSHAFRDLRQHEDAQSWNQYFEQLLAEAITNDHGGEDLELVARGFRQPRVDSLHPEYWRDPLTGRR